ncbi:MAG: spore cortex biosynthesis protein YabQ [Firmicutes bacterium]|nr:spore cortex biosynthesis protein YabQ [Bacillota bacterium]
MEDLTFQLYAFAITILAGLSIGIIFDFYRLIRKVLRPGIISTAIMDLIFWLVISPLTIIYILLANWGELRFYVFLGISLGLVFYFLALSRPIISMVMWVCESVARLLGFICNLLLRIIALPLRLIQDLGIVIQGSFKGWKPLRSRRKIKILPPLRWRTTFLAFRRR